MRVVVDTNVWVSGLILPDSTPGAVLRAIRDRRIDIAVSWALAEELAEVMRRPRIRRYGVTERDIGDLMVLLAPFLPSVQIHAPLRDPDDAPVIAAAVQGGASAIVTGDQDLLEDPELVSWLADRRIEVITPATLMDRLGSTG